MDFLRPILGLIVFIGLAWLLSENRKHVNWLLVVSGVVIQFIIALLVLQVPAVSSGFQAIASGFTLLLNYSQKGAEFVLGPWPADVWVGTETTPGGEITFTRIGFIFAFRVLPTILFFSALSAALYYIGLLQLVVKGFAWIMSKTMKLSGAESVAMAANIFVGQTEAPLVIKPYLENMSRSEIMCLMTGGMATIAGGVFGAYVAILGGSDPAEQARFATHLLSASIMAAPAAIVFSKLLVPELPEDNPDRALNIPRDKIGANLLEAISTGTRDGLGLAVNVGAMLLTFTAFMYMLNGLLLWTGGWTGLNDLIATGGQYEGLTLQFLLGKMFSPVAWLIGIDYRDLALIGQVLGEKTILNEFFAYSSLGEMKDTGELHNERSVIIATYALCGFANFASIGIQIGGISSLAPGQRSTLARLGLSALLAGTLACLMTAAIAALLI